VLGTKKYQYSEVVLIVLLITYHSGELF